MVDAQHADRVVAVTDHLRPHPLCPIDISQDKVDFVVSRRFDRRPARASCRARRGRPPTRWACRSRRPLPRVIAASGLLREGFSLQTGAGGVSIADLDCT